MDRKAITIIVLSFALMLMWGPMVNRLFPPTPKPAIGTNSVTLTNSGTLSNASISAANTNVANGTQPLAVSTTNAPAPSATQTNRAEELIVIEDADARYHFTSKGGGIKLVELKKYPATVACEKGTNAATGALATLNAGAQLPMLSLFGDEKHDYALERLPAGVRASATLPNGTQIIKEFSLTSNYVVRAKLRMENRSGEAITVPPHAIVVGTATPTSAHDETAKLGIQWYNGSKTEAITYPYFENRTLGCFPGTPRSEYVGGSSNVFWAAVHNQFFTAIAVPVSPSTNQPAPLPNRVLARKVELPKPTPAQIAEDSRVYLLPFGFETTFQYDSVTLPAASAYERHYDLYAGPKEYRTLAKLPNNLDLVMGFGGFFGWFAKILLLAMNGFHSMGLSYGLAIIAITVVIKLLFWPLTTASTRSMKRLAELQPEMKKLQEKYKDDPQKMNQKMMQFMKENKVNPLGGCLPILIQLPFFFGFYTMLQSAIELRGASFLWACDLSQPDTIAVVAGFPINIMPIFMAGTMLWQARLTPPSPGMDPMQANMMRYMPLIFVVMLYNFSAGLTLYWTVQNLLSIAQMKLTKSNKPSGPAAPAAPAKGAHPRK